VAAYKVQDIASGKSRDVKIPNSAYKGKGGEKSIFIVGTKAYGIYHDVKNVMDVDKAKELATLTRPNIIRPTDLLFKGSKRVGEAMLAVPDPFVLCQLFTRTFSERYGVESKHKVHVIKEMQQTLAHIHQHQCYAIDNNENNWLISKDFQRVYAIDIGNWETPSFKSKFIMLNIRDRKQKSPVGQDWFSHAILSSCILIGKHPYEATHPKFKHLPKADVKNGVNIRPRMEAMMDEGLTFFDKDATLPKVCYHLDTIPGAFKAWMQAVLIAKKHLRISSVGIDIGLPPFFRLNVWIPSDMITTVS